MYKKLLLALLLFFSLPAISYAEDVGKLLGEAIEDINFQSFDLAEEKLRKVLNTEPENPYAKYYLASALSQAKRAEEAVPYLESIKSSASLFPEYDNLLASVYMAANQPEKAAPIYKRLIPDTFDPAKIFQYATALEQSGQSDAALKAYTRLTKLDNPYRDAAYYQSATTLSAIGANIAAYDALSLVDSHSSYGEAAQSYQSSLKASLKPFSVYLSGEYFYTDNPGSTSSTYAKGAVAQAPAQGSTGQTLIAALTAGAWEINHHTKATFGYTYYASFYTEASAKGNEFAGHFFAPVLTYTYSPTWRLDIKLDYQTLNLGPYTLSNNAGGGLTLNYSSQDQLSSAFVGLSYMRKRYNPSFGETGFTVDMRYLDADSPTINAGGSLVYSDSGAMLSLDYSLLFEQTLGSSNAILSEKAQDSKFREHTLTINHHLPFSDDFSKLSIDASLGYSYRNYLNPQSGTSLPSIAPGNYLTAQTTTATLKAQYLLWPAYGVRVIVGTDWASATSHATELSYTQARYYTQVSGSY